jgi:hypothetical protein
MDVRSIFTILSLINLIWYFCKIVCQTPQKFQPQLTFDQKSLVPLSFMLFLFNDPWYTLHVYTPSFFTFVLSELQIAMFIAALMVYWIRDLARYKKKMNSQNLNAVGKLVSYSLGDNKVMMCFLVVFYLLLVASFMTLYIAYFQAVKGDPAFVGEIKLDEEAFKDNEIVSIPLSVLAILLCIYYVWFLCALANHLRLIMHTSTS